MIRIIRLWAIIQFITPGILFAGQLLPGTRILRGGRLEIEVMDPDSTDRYNQGLRFSPIANVLRARLDGVEFLYSPGGPAHDPKIDNGGLASEFDPFSCTNPPGFAEARIGEGFVKIGVGVLEKTGDEYHFSKSYPLLSSALTRSTWGVDRASFQQICEGINGYAYCLTTEVKVEGNCIALVSRLTNTGKRQFSTTQYAHNFFNFGGIPIGSAYEVEFPYKLPPLKLLNGLPQAQTQRGHKIMFLEKLRRSSNVRIPYPADYQGKNWVLVRNVENGQQITAATSLPGIFIQLHANLDYLCPEQFIRLTLAPGDSAEWTRTYQFELNGRGATHQLGSIGEISVPQ